MFTGLEILIKDGDMTGVRNFVGKNFARVSEGVRFMMPDSGLALLPPPHLGEHTVEITRRMNG